jgi:hypothetical protein
MSSMRQRKADEPCLGEFDAAVEEILKFTSNEPQGQEHVEWMIRLHIGQAVDAILQRSEQKFLARQESMLERQKRKHALRAKFDDKENAAGLAKTQRKVSELEAALTKKDAEASERLLSHAEKIHDLNIEVEAVKSRKSALEQIVERLELAAKKHETSASEAGISAQEQQKKLTASVRQLEKELLSAQEQQKKLTETVQQLEEERLSAKEQQKKLTATVQQLEQERLSALEEQKKLAARAQQLEQERLSALEQINKLTASVHQLEQERHAWESEAVDAKRQLNAVQLERDELLEQCRTIEQAVVERDVLKQHLVEMQGQLTMATAERNALVVSSPSCAAAARAEPVEQQAEFSRQEDTQDFTAMLRNLERHEKAVRAPETFTVASTDEGNKGNVQLDERERETSTIVNHDTQDLVALLGASSNSLLTVPPPLPRPLETTENLAELLVASVSALPSVPSTAKQTSIPIPSSQAPPANRAQYAAREESAAAARPKTPPAKHASNPLTSQETDKTKAAPSMAGAAATTQSRLASTTPPPAARRYEWDFGSERAVLSASLSASTLPTYAGSGGFALSMTPKPGADQIHSSPQAALTGSNGPEEPRSRLISRKRACMATSQAEGVTEQTAKHQPDLNIVANGIDEMRTPDRAAGPLRNLWQRLSFRR